MRACYKNACWLNSLRPDIGRQKHMGGDSTLTWCNTMSMNKTNKTWRVHYALQICRATWEETGSCYEMASPKKCLETSWTEKSNRNMMEKNRKRIKRLQPRSANQKHQGCWVQFNCAQGATVWWPRPGTIVPRWWKKLGLCAAPSVMEHCQTVWFFPLALTVDLLSKTIIIHSMNINHIIYMKYHDTVPKKTQKTMCHEFDEFPFNWHLARATETICEMHPWCQLNARPKTWTTFSVCDPNRQARICKKGTNNGRCFVSLARSEDANVLDGLAMDTTWIPRGWCPMNFCFGVWHHIWTYTKYTSMTSKWMHL